MQDVRKQRRQDVREQRRQVGSEGMQEVWRNGAGKCEKGREEREARGGVFK